MKYVVHYAEIHRGYIQRVLFKNNESRFILYNVYGDPTNGRTRMLQHRKITQDRRNCPHDFRMIATGDFNFIDNLEDFFPLQSGVSSSVDKNIIENFHNLLSLPYLLRLTFITKNLLFGIRAINMPND